MYGGDPQAQLRRLAKDLKDAGEKDLRKALYRNLNAAAAPLLEDVKREAAATLPRSGGAADRVAGAKYRSRVMSGIGNGGGAGGATTGVRLTGAEVGGAKVNLKKINRGILRHPLFGQRGQGQWFNTPVPPGFWDRPLRRGGPKARAAVIAAVDEMAARFYA